MSPNKLIVKILNEFSNDEHFETLNLLTEWLENKDDPDPSEIMLVDSIYQFLEKKSILESQLRTLNKSNHKNKLAELLAEQEKFDSWDL